MKKILIPTILCMNIALFAQPLRTEWTIKPGGRFYDQANAVDSDANGNVFMTGYFQDRAIFGTEHITTLGGTGIYVAKYDRDGILAWVRTAGNEYSTPNVISEFGTSVAVDNRGGLYVVGGFRHVVHFFESQTIQSAGKDDLFIAKYGLDGDLAWVTQAGGASQDIVNDIDTDEDGSVLITGHFQNEARFGKLVFHSADFTNFFLAKYTSDGEVLWVTDSNQTGDATGSAVVSLGNELFVAGNFQGEIAIGNKRVQSAGGTDIFVAKFSSAGECTFLAAVGNGADETANDLDVTANGIVVTGSYLDRTSDSRKELCFVASLNLLGEQKWIKRLKGDQANEGRAVSLLKNGHLIVGGYFAEAIEFEGVKTAGHPDGNIFLLNLDGEGTVQWSDMRPFDTSALFKGMVVNDDFVIIVGSIVGSESNENIFSSSSPVVPTDILAEKLQLPRASNVRRVRESALKVYPNPTTGAFGIYYHFSSLQQHVNITVSDIVGKIVFEKSFNNVDQVEADVHLSGLSKGLYNVLLSSGDIEIYKKVVVR